MSGFGRLFRWQGVSASVRMSKGAFAFPHKGRGHDYGGNGNDEEQHHYNTTVPRPPAITFKPDFEALDGGGGGGGCGGRGSSRRHC
jgi:hypothetical protein